MTSSYENIYSCFLSKITEYKFVTLPQDDAYELMRGWLRSAVSKPYIRRIFSSLKLDDEVLQIQFEVLDTVDKYTDFDYAVEVIASGMVIEWLEPQVKSVVNIAQMFGGAEQKFYAQSTHLSELRKLLDESKAELRKMIRDHGYFFREYSGKS